MATDGGAAADEDVGTVSTSAPAGLREEDLSQDHEQIIDALKKKTQTLLN